MRSPSLLMPTCLLLMVAAATGCVSPGASGPPGSPGPHGPPAKRDVARAHYQAGWAFIMDEGRWTESEGAYRAAMAADPDWGLSRVMVGRITSDLAERESLLSWVETHRSAADPDERLLIDLYVMNLRAANARDRGEMLEPEFFARRTRLAITNFRAYLNHHPQDAYISAELIEWIHAAQGARAALEAIPTDIDPRARQVPFFLSYRASLLSELGRFGEALAVAAAFEALIDDPLAPAPHHVYAGIDLHRGHLEQAREHVERALALDQGHVLARRLRDEIDARLARR